MNTSAAQAATFYREVAVTSQVWCIRDDGGFPAPLVVGERRSMPFWSSEKRALKVIENVDAYVDFKPVAIPWNTFCERWVPGLMTDGFPAGVNWSGPYATGYDVEPTELQRNVQAQLEEIVRSTRNRHS